MKRKKLTISFFRNPSLEDTGPARYLLIVLFSFLPLYTTAQVAPQFYDYPYNHLPWYTIESEHFMVHYQEGSSRTAQVTSRIAEEVYGPITGLYDYEPERQVSIIIRDREDFSNGAAFFFDDKIEIWVPALDTPLRGTHNWLRNVITHEFTHIVQLQASMNRSKRIPAIYLQWLSYEDVRRPDVLYGFPNGVVTFPFATVSIPAWYAEGTAQYQRSGLAYDYWDSHRDMIFRTRIMDDQYLDLTTMGTFTSKSSIEREVVYNQGYAFTIYLVDRFGEDVLREISIASADGKTNFAKAMESATGINGYQIFDDFIEDRKEFYQTATHQQEFTETELVEPAGYFNFYPQFSRDQQTFAYISNKGREYGRTALYLKKENGDALAIDELSGPGLLSNRQNYAVKHNMTSNPVLDFISDRFSFSPDGNRLAYNRSMKNRYGEMYNDLYLYHIEDEEIQQLTHSERIREPAWNPNEEQLAAVKLHKGTENLILYNLETDSLRQLTNFQSGETVYSPVWHPEGSKIYFAYADLGNRGIYSIDLVNHTIEEVLVDDFIDFRDPYFNEDDGFLYFSSDPDGIFNIYRMHPDEGQIQKITSVTGGAFMPHIRGDQLYFSEYRTDGYKISKMNLIDRIDETAVGYNPLYPDHIGEITIDRSILELNDFDDRDIQALNHSALRSDSTLHIETLNASDERSWSTYRETITGFSFFPVLRFDNYTKQNGSNSSLLKAGQFGSLGENLWRDAKAGFYFSSRDVTERLSIFGGALLGFGSKPADGLNDFFRPGRINDLDRDLFLIIEHRGVPFIEASWSPTVALELYNLKRNVRDGLQIEEFPCTSCLPETTNTDILYNIWEAGLYLRSKLNRWSLLELGATYSPYRVSTDGFFSRELQQFIPGSTSEYFRGTTLSASYIAELIEPTRHNDISPIGLKGSFSYRYQPSKLLDQYEINEGILSPVYDQVKNHSLELRVRYGIPLWNQSTTQLQARGFAYLNSPDDYFYNDYIGGLAGIRSYPFFAVGGEQTAFARISYLTPLIQNINRQVGPYTFDKLYLNLFAESGKVWNSPLQIGQDLKNGLGGELRFAFNSYYLFPLKFFLSGSYGLNRFDVTLSDDFITGAGGNRVSYGRELLFYFGLTFDFDLL